MKSWKEKATDYITSLGYDEFTASKLYYRAEHRLSKLISKNFDLEFETYASLRFKKNFIKYDIKSERLYQRIDGSYKELIETDKLDFEKEYTKDRLEDLAFKYIDVALILKDYLSEKITLSELNEKIKNFKRTDSTYHKEGSE